MTKDSGGLHKAQAQDKLPGRFGIGNEGYEHIHSASSRVKVRADQPLPVRTTYYNPSLPVTRLHVGVLLTLRVNPMGIIYIK